MNELNVRVGVVIPAYRAETTIAAVVAGVPSEVSHIFVVDDASPDGTSRAVLDARDARVRLIRHEQNRGVGGATKTGYQAALDAGCEVVVKMDADNQMDPTHLPALVRPLVSGEAGYTKGNRLWSLESWRGMPRRRLIGNLGLSLAAKAASGYWNIVDPTNGYTAIRADVLKRLDFARLDERYFFENTMLVELHLLRVPVRDVLMPARYRGAPSSLRVLPTLFEFSGKLPAAMARRLVLEYLVLDFRPATFFALAGMLLTASGAVFGVLHWWRSVTTGHEASAGTVMLAALPFLLGVQLLLQAGVQDVAEVRSFTPLPPLTKQPSSTGRR